MTTLDELVNGPTDKPPGVWRRKGENGPPIVSDPDGQAVQSGPRKGNVRLLTYSRPSNFGKQVENTYNLEKWSERQVAIGLTAASYTNPDLWPRLDEIVLHRDPDDKTTKEALDGIVVEAKRLAGATLAADRGTHSHTLTEDGDLGRSIVTRLADGEDLGLSPALQQAVVDVWNTLVDTYFEVLAVEFPCVYDRWRVAGTLDRIVRTRIDLTFQVGRITRTIKAGTVIVLDIKTGGLKLDRDGVPRYWHSYAVQIAAYARSVPYDVDLEQRGTWDWPIDPNHAVIAHIDIAQAIATGTVCAQLFYVDLDAGHAAGELVCAAKAWQNRRDILSVADVYTVHTVIPEPAPEVDMRSGLVNRVRALVDAGHADQLAVLWPTGLPGFRGDYQHTEAELRAIASTVRHLEDRVGIVTGFVTADQLEQAPTPTPEPKVQRRLTDVAVVEGDLIGDAAYQALAGTVLELGDAVVRLEQIAQQAADAGMPISLAQMRSIRRFEIIRAIVQWTKAGWDDDIIRDLLAVILDTDIVRHPATPLGAAIGALTIDEAGSFADMAQAVHDGAGLTHNGDRWVVTNTHGEQAT